MSGKETGRPPIVPDSLLRPFVTGLVQGRYRSAREAAHLAATSLAPLAKPQSANAEPGTGGKPASPLNWRTLHKRILAQAEAQGWRDAHGWSKQELAILNDFGRDVVQGRYRNAMVAARAYLGGLEDLQRRFPGARWLKMDRTLNGVFLKLVKRLKQKSGWSEALWPEPEFEFAERFARGVVAGRYPRALDAARDFLRARDELRQQHPEIVWLRRRRSLKSAQRVIVERAHRMGWSKLVVQWGGPEKQVADRYARAIVRGEYRSVLQAGRPCLQELARLHREHPDERWSRAARPLKAVQSLLQQRVKRLGVPRHGSRWSSGENAILDRYAQRVGTPGYRRLTDAAKDCARELARRHRRELRRNSMLAPIPPRTFNAVLGKLKARALALRTWGP